MFEMGAQKKARPRLARFDVGFRPSDWTMRKVTSSLVGVDEEK